MASKTGRVLTCRRTSGQTHGSTPTCIVTQAITETTGTSSATAVMGNQMESDGQPNGEGFSADIVSWKIPLATQRQDVSCSAFSSWSYLFADLHRARIPRLVLRTLSTSGWSCALYRCAS